MSKSQNKHEPNDRQREAIEYGIGKKGRKNRDLGPVLILAGAGTGKTQTVALRVARLIASGVDPQRILLLTFSRQAADELKQRVASILAAANKRGKAATTNKIQWAGTFHAVGVRLLRLFADDLGLDGQFTIHDREDSADLMGMLHQDQGLGQLSKSSPPVRLASKSIRIRSMRSARLSRC